MSVSGVNNPFRANGSNNAQNTSASESLDRQSSYTSINNLTESLLSEINTEEDNPIIQSNRPQVNLKETLLSAENIAADKLMLGEMNQTIKGLKGEDALLGYLSEEALKYEFGENTSMEDFTVLAENYDESSGFTFTTYQNGEQTITLFSKYDEIDKHAELVS